MVEQQQEGRRQFIARAMRVGTAALAGGALFTAESTRAADQQSWADIFYYTAGGIPDKGTSPDGKFGEFGVRLEPGQTAIMVLSQFRYDSKDPMTGEQLFVKGREDHPVVVVVNSDPEKPVTVRNFSDMPVNGGWLGLVKNPDNTPSLTEEQLYEAISVRIKALRDPKLNNCAPGKGCTDSIEYVAIGAKGDVTDHGARYR